MILTLRGEVHLKNGRLCVVKRKQNTQLTIELWTSIFIIFMSSVLKHNIAQAQEILKYIRDIRFAAICSFTWYKYGELFRLSRSHVSNPSMPWGEIHSELWLMYVNNQTTLTNKNYSKLVYYSSKLRTLMYYGKILWYYG